MTRSRSALFLVLIALAVGAVMVAVACGSQQDGTRTADDEDDEGDGEGNAPRRTEGDGRPRQRQPDEVGDTPAEDSSTGDVPEVAEAAKSPPRHEIDPRAQSNIESGVRRAASGDLSGALNEFEDAVRADSKAYSAHYNIGVIRERQGQSREAREAYQRALEIQPDYERAIDALARMDVRAGNINAALSFVEQRARQYNGNLPLMVTYADLLVIAERFRDAQQVARQVLRRNERSVPAMLVFAKSNYHLGRLDLALWILEQAAEVDANNAEIFNVRGFVRLARSERLLAIEDFERAVQIRPDYAEAQNNLGVQYLISGRYADAIQHLEAAQRLNPNWVSVYLNIGDAYRGNQDWTKAKNALEKALRLESELPEAHYNLGVLYLAATKIEGMDRSQQLQKSIESFQRYKSMMASRLDREDPVHRLLQDAQRSLEREQERIQSEREAAEEAARREKARPAPTPAADAGAGAGTTPPAGDAGAGEDIQWE
jgi:tetratricopeptide (TPR) repeat protein